MVSADATMTLILGVDAGGSRTTAAVADAGGAILARGESGPGAVRPGAVEQAAGAILAACRDALQRARREAPADVLVVGASGAGREAERGELAHALMSHGLARRVEVTTDAEIALLAAFGDRPGIVLIAGTGSVAWARLPDRTTARAGGLGPVLGDWGSAYDVAREALRAAARAVDDGRAQGLLDRLLQRLGIGVDQLPRWSLGARVPDLVTLAPVVVEAAGAGDETARRILERAAADLAATVTPLLHRFPAGAAVTLAWGGGLLVGSPDYRAAVLGKIIAMRPAIAVLDGPVDAVAGAVRMAARRLGG